MENPIKTIYKRRNKIPKLIEGLDNMTDQSLDEYYVKLQMIIKEEDKENTEDFGRETMAGQKQDINITDLFEKTVQNTLEKDIHKILILGGAGVGKSTLMQYIAYKWSLDELWADKFDYVYLISLKTILNENWTQIPWSYDFQDLNDSRLKCLAHHGLKLNKDERSKILPNSLPWLRTFQDDSRILLLLDGFDEVAHKWGNHAHTDFFDEIFQFKHVIMTSRPNSVNKRMRAKFDRLIENNGLDKKGIEEYLEKYFQKENTDKKEGLLEFLSRNPIIKEISKVPVNIALICYMWAYSDNNLRLQEISNISVLYQEMIQLLGKRYIRKKLEATNSQENYDLNNPLDILEFKILSHTAYKAMTGGGVGAKQNEGTVTLLIPGAISENDTSNQKKLKLDLKDTNGISLQSSINYFRNLEDREIFVEVQNIYKYGLLKTEEGISTSSKDLSNTDLQMQIYSFIHLTFQEYCAAYYLKYRLEKGEQNEKSEICHFLAEHRNEPRYAMTLKFMAGILTADKRKEIEPAVKMFWEAMVCNVDGVIELGIETKVALMLHLMGQASANMTQLDSRIPNKQGIIDFIDVVVIKDILAFYNQLEESGYITENIKEAIIKGLSDNTQEWQINKMKEISNRSQPAMRVIIENMIGQLESQMNKSETVKSLNYQKMKISRAAEVAINVLRKMDGVTKNQYSSYIFDELIKIITRSEELIGIGVKQIAMIISEVNLMDETTKVIELIDILLSDRSEALKDTKEEILNTIIFRIENDKSASSLKLSKKISKLLLDKEIDCCLIKNFNYMCRQSKEANYLSVMHHIFCPHPDKKGPFFYSGGIASKDEIFYVLDRIIQYFANGDFDIMESAINIINEYYIGFLGSISYFNKVFKFYANQKSITRNIAINAFMLLVCLYCKQQRLDYKIKKELVEKEEEKEEEEEEQEEQEEQEQEQEQGEEEQEQEQEQEEEEEQEQEEEREKKIEVNKDTSDLDLIEKTTKIITKLTNCEANLEKGQKETYYMVLWATKIQSGHYKFEDDDNNLQSIFDLLESKSPKNLKCTIKALPEIIDMMDNKEELASRVFKKLLTTFLEGNKDIKSNIIKTIGKISLFLRRNEIVFQALQELLNNYQLHEEDNKIISTILRVLILNVKRFNCKASLASQAIKEVLNYEPTKNNKMTMSIIKMISKLSLIKKIKNSELFLLGLEFSIDCLQLEDTKVKKTAIKFLEELVKKADDSCKIRAAPQMIKKLLNCLTGDNFDAKRTGIKVISEMFQSENMSQMFEFLKNKDLISEVFQELLNILKNDQDVRDEAEYFFERNLLLLVHQQEILKKVLWEFFTIVKNDNKVLSKYYFKDAFNKIKDQEVLRDVFNLLDGLFEDQNEHIRKTGLQVLEIVIEEIYTRCNGENLDLLCFEYSKDLFQKEDDEVLKLAIQSLEMVIKFPKDAHKEEIFSQSVIMLFKILSHEHGDNQIQTSAAQTMTKLFKLKVKGSMPSEMKQGLANIIKNDQSMTKTFTLDLICFLNKIENEGADKNTIFSQSVTILFEMMSQKDSNLRTSATKTMIKLFELKADEFMPPEAIEGLFNIITNDQNMMMTKELTGNFISLMGKLRNENTLQNVLNLIKDIFKNQNEDAKMLAVGAFEKLLESWRYLKKVNNGLATLYFEYSINFCKEEKNHKIVKRLMEAVLRFTKNYKLFFNKEQVSQAILKLIDFMSHNHKNIQKLAAKLMSQIIDLTKDKNILFQGFTSVVDLLKTDQKIIKANELEPFLINIKDKEMMRSALNLTKDFLKIKLNIFLVAIKKVIYRLPDINLALACLEYSLDLLQKEDNEEAAANAGMEFLYNLKKANKKFKYFTEDNFSYQVFQHLIKWVVANKDSVLQVNAIKTIRKWCSSVKMADKFIELLQELFNVFQNDQYIRYEVKWNLILLALRLNYTDVLIGTSQIAKNLFKDQNGNIIQPAIKQFSYFVQKKQKKYSPIALFKYSIDLLDDKASEIVITGMKALINLAKFSSVVITEDLASQAVKKLLYIARQNNHEMKLLAVYAISKIFFKINDKESFLEAFLQETWNILNIFDKLQFNDEIVAIDYLFEILKVAKDANNQDLVFQNIEKLKLFFSSKNSEYKEFVLKKINQTFTLKNDKELLLRLYEFFFSIIKKDFDTDNKHKIPNVFRKVLSKIRDKELIKIILDLNKDLIKIYCEIVLTFTSKIKDVKDPELTVLYVGYLLDNLQDPHVKTVFQIVNSLFDLELIEKYDILPDLATNFLQQLKKLIKSQKYSFKRLKTKKKLNNLASLISKFKFSLEITTDYISLPHEEFKNCLNYYLVQSFNEFILKFDIIDNLLKEKQDFDTKTLTLRINSMNLEKSFQFELVKQIDYLKQANLDINLFNIKQRMNYIGNKKGHELIEIALFLLGDQDVLQVNEPHLATEYDKSKNMYKLKLSNCIKQVLELQAEYLSPEGLEWLNDKFEYFSQLSKQSRPFFKKISHKMLEDSEITQLEEQLMIKLINLGLTTSITREREIIFEGKKYAIKGKNVEQLLERISSGVIQQKQDPLAIQYEQHDPIFMMNYSNSIGIIIEASSDIKKVFSFVERSYELSNDKWLMTEFIEITSRESTKQILIMEQRNTLGDHVIYNLNTQEVKKINPLNVDRELERLFGKYDQAYKVRYYGRSKVLLNSVGYEIISNNGSESNVEFESVAGDQLPRSKIYFQQELLNNGYQDRLLWLASELDMKIDGNKRIEEELDDLTPGTDQTKLMDYYRTFLQTFTEVYTTAQAIESEKLVLDPESSPSISVLSTMLSFLPVIGDKTSNAVESMDKFMKTQEMKNTARRMSQLASNHVELYQIVSSSALEIIRDKTKRNQIITSDNIEEEEEKMTSGFFEEFLSGKFQDNLKTKIGKIINSKIFGEVYKSPAAKLSNKDANELIQGWISKSIDVEKFPPQERQDSMIKQFVEAIIVKSKQNSGSLNNNVSLNQKLEEARNLLESDIRNLDFVNLTQRNKLMDYYDAFLLTFIETYIIAEALESKKVKLVQDNNQNKTTITDNLIEPEEMINSSRRILLLATSYLELCNLVNKSVRDIIRNEGKRKQIIETTGKKKETRSLFGELMNGESADALKKEFEARIGTKLDSKKKNNSATKLGKSDANELIQMWINKIIDIDTNKVPPEVRQESIRQQFIN